MPHRLLIKSSVPAAFSCSSDVNWLASIRGRVGVTPFGARTLLYATGGWGWTGIDNQASPAAGGFGPTSTTYSGFVAGGGLEHAASSNWTYKLEYLGYFLDKERTPTPIGASMSSPRSILSSLV